MATDKMFTVAGTSKMDGEMKVRFANDVMRVKVLAKHGHEDITLIELPDVMSKLEAVKFLKGLDEFQGVAEQMAIDDYLDRNSEKTPAVKTPTAEKPTKASPAPKVKAEKAPAKTKAEVAAVLAEAEDASF